MKTPIAFRLNGEELEHFVEPRWTLAEFLRDHLHKTGTHMACDTSQCGACTVHVDDVALKSCAFLAVQADGRSVTTIEGLATDAGLHPMQEAFRECHGLQCGYCTPGMVMSALDMVRREKVLSPEIVVRNLAGNICRCTGYYNIVKAILKGAERMGCPVEHGD